MANEAEGSRPNFTSQLPGNLAEMQQLHRLFNVTVGDAIRLHRHARGLTQMKVAEIADLSTNYVARLERGELGPSLRVAHRIALALQIPIAELLREPELDKAAGRLRL